MCVMRYDIFSSNVLVPGILLQSKYTNEINNYTVFELFYPDLRYKLVWNATDFTFHILYINELQLKFIIYIYIFVNLHVIAILN